MQDTCARFTPRTRTGEQRTQHRERARSRTFGRSRSAVAPRLSFLLRPSGGSFPAACCATPSARGCGRPCSAMPPARPKPPPARASCDPRRGAGTPPPGAGLGRLRGGPLTLSIPRSRSSSTGAAVGVSKNESQCETTARTGAVLPRVPGLPRVPDTPLRRELPVIGVSGATLRTKSMSRNSCSRRLDRVRS